MTTDEDIEVLMLRAANWRDPRSWPSVRELLNHFQTKADEAEWVGDAENSQAFRLRAQVYRELLEQGHERIVPF